MQTALIQKNNTMTDLQILQQLLNSNHLSPAEILRAEKILFVVNSNLKNLKII
jgi:hypothetical protein